MDIALLFIGTGILIPFILLFGRKKKWASDRLRWMITGFLFMVGLTGILVKGQVALKEGFQFLFIPIIYNWVDRFFKNISVRKNNRDFYLYLKYSDEIDDRMFAENPHITLLDKLLSFGLLLLIFGLMFAAVLLTRAVFLNKYILAL